MAEAFRAGGGRISVEEFMRLALYDEEHGYYTKNIKTVGRGGDFSTSATMHGALAGTIANWLSKLDVIEIGAGDGSLAESVLSSFGWWRRRKTLYNIVDASPPLRRVQKERLAKFGKRVVWHDSVEEALAGCGGVADLFSNELVDAFPATVLNWSSELHVWQEVFVDVDGNEVFDASKDAPEWEPVSDRQRIERHLSYRDWLEGWLPKWSAGRMLTIDYGAEFPAVYHRRPTGTLRAYFAQMRLDGAAEFYQRVGKQDLTADVNFSELMAWGESLGLKETRVRSQRDFLLELNPKLSSAADRDPALEFLLDPNGAGGAFCALEQSR